MPEQTFLSTFADFLKANPRESFEALQPKYEALKEESRRQNEQTRREYLARLQAEKTAQRAERERLDAVAALAREAEVKRFLRYRYSTLPAGQYDAMWPDIYREFLLDEANKSYHEMRRQYQF